jgi:hypothetical protein
MTRLLVLIIAVGAMITAQPARSAEVGAGGTQSAPSDVSAAGKISSHFSVAGDLVHFAFTVRNDSASELRDLQIVSLPSDYRLEQLYPPPACDDIPSVSVKNLISRCLPSRQSLVAWGNLRAASPHKAETLLMVLHWKAVSPAAIPNGNKAPTGNRESESSLAIDLGENEVQSKFWVAISDYLPIVVLPLAVPAVLALLTFLLNWHLARNTRRTEVWKQMLAVMQNYGAKFYMPMSSAASGLVEELPRKGTPVAFFFFLLLQRTMLDAVGEIGGVFFNDQRGEIMMNACWSKIFDLFYPQGRSSPFYLCAYAAARLVEPRSNYQEFSSRFVVQSRSQQDFAHADLRQCWILFRPFIANLPEDAKDLIVLLRAFSTVLDCEINRTNKYWYPSVARVDVRDDVLKKLREVAKNEGMSGWARFWYFWAWRVDK